MKRLDDAREDLAKALELAPEDEQVNRLYARAKKAAGARTRTDRTFELLAIISRCYNARLISFKLSNFLASTISTR